MEASPRRCHECFPEISPQAFFARKRFIQSHFELVDLFLSPSRFLIDRYVDWGIPREKMRFEPNGRIRPQEGVSAADAPRASSHSTGPAGSERPRNRFAFCGQFNRFKGVQVLLEAMRILAEEAPEDGSGNGAGDGEATAEARPLAWLHGANLELRSPEFRRDFEERLEATRGNVTLVGRYERDDLPELMKAVDWVVIPSIWWENSPLVIQEAFMHGRPVICSDIGGMAEKVEDGVSGLQFRTGDARSLADTMRAAARDPELWSRLQRGIPEVYWMDEAVESISGIYDELLERKKSEEAA